MLARKGPTGTYCVFSIFIYTCVCMCRCICIYIYKYVYIYVYTFMVFRVTEDMFSKIEKFRGNCS